MPIKHAGIKYLRKSKKNQKRNIVKKKELSKLEKSLRKLAATGKKDEAKKTLQKLYKALDKAAKTNLIKKNTASRKKSRLSVVVNKIGKEVKRVEKKAAAKVKKVVKPKLKK